MNFFAKNLSADCNCDVNLDEFHAIDWDVLSSFLFHSKNKYNRSGVLPLKIL